MSGFDGHLIVTKLAKSELVEGRNFKGFRVLAKNGEKYSTIVVLIIYLPSSDQGMFIFVWI